MIKLLLHIIYDYPVFKMMTFCLSVFNLKKNIIEEIESRVTQIIPGWIWKNL